MVYAQTTTNTSFYNDIKEWELYDLKEEPTRMHNLYSQPKYEKIWELNW